MQSCLDKLTKIADKSAENPWEIPDGWFTVRSEILSLTHSLLRLDVPCFPLSPFIDFRIEDLYTWTEYLSQVTPLARAGALNEARALVLEGVNDQ